MSIIIRNRTDLQVTRQKHNSLDYDQSPGWNTNQFSILILNITTHDKKNKQLLIKFVYQTETEIYLVECTNFSIKFINIY